MHHGVVDENPSLLHYLFNETQAQRVGHIPAYPDKHDFQRIVQSFENLPKSTIDKALADILHGLYCRRVLSQHNQFYMKKLRFTESQIINILKQAEASTPVPELCREHGMSSASFYKWQRKYGGMNASMMMRMEEKELEDENRRFKKMYAEEKLKAEIISETIQKKW